VTILFERKEVPLMSKTPMRSCLVTRESHPRNSLLRFVTSPEGQVVFDVKKNLPGRGMWLSPKKEIIEQAVAQNAFSRGAKQSVKVSADLIYSVEKTLKERIAHYLQRARVSRDMFSGFEKCASALRGGEASLLIHASDAKEDGVRKLHKLIDPEYPIAEISPFTREELADYWNLPNPVHGAVTSKTLAQTTVKVYNDWAGFIGKDQI
jgi:predicted RNA-binding protein YlxR (DUF448 family)